MSGGATTRGSHGGLIATVVAVALLVCGLLLIGAAIASQESVSEPPIVSVAPTASPGATPAPPPAREKVAFTLDASKPVTLDIPAIGVHSVVRDVGRTSDGALETPAPGPHYDEAAWYRHSPTPGSLGPAVLLGHVDSASTGPSVFFRLGEVRPGDRVSITRADNSIALFDVDEVHRYSKNDFPTELVYGDIDHAGLRIVTCGGAFDDSTGHYLDNIVVFASLVDPGNESAGE